MFQGLWDALRDLLWWIVGWLYTLVGTFNAYIEALFADFFDAIMDAVYNGIDAVIDWAFDSLPDLSGYFDFSALAGYLSDVAWILPIRQSMILVAGVYGCIFTIRVVRWVLGVIPTLNL